MHQRTRYMCLKVDNYNLLKSPTQMGIGPIGYSVKASGKKAGCQSKYLQLKAAMFWCAKITLQKNTRCQWAMNLSKNMS